MQTSEQVEFQEILNLEQDTEIRRLALLRPYNGIKY